MRSFHVSEKQYTPNGGTIFGLSVWLNGVEVLFLKI